MILFNLVPFLLLFLGSAENHFQFEAAPASFDRTNCAEYRIQFEKCRTVLEVLTSAVPKSTLALSDTPDECKWPWFFISKTCGWMVTGVPASFPRPTGYDHYSTAVTAQPTSVPMETRDWTCPPGYHYLTKNFDTYHYFFCCPNDNNRLLLPQAYTALPMCCNNGDRVCKGKPVNIEDACHFGLEITDWGGIKGCRGRKIVKREGDFDVVEVGDHPDLSGKPHGFPTDIPHGWPGHAWGSKEPTTLDTKTTGPKAASVSASQSKSGTTTVTNTITPPATPAATTQAADDFSVKMEVSEVRFPSATFQWPGGLCEFCNQFNQGKVRQGSGLPFGVMPDAASSECSNSATSCTPARTAYPWRTTV